MPRKLKVYQTSQGFYDLAIAAPSMKAALEAWGAGSNWFHQDLAREAVDNEIISVALGKPGKVLRRPVGSTGPFGENSALPTVASLERALPGHLDIHPSKVRLKTPEMQKGDEKANRAAAANFEKEQRKRERQREKDEAAAAKANELRKAAVAKVEAEFERDSKAHEDVLKRIENERVFLDRREKAENERWDKTRERFTSALKRARG